MSEKQRGGTPPANKITDAGEPRTTTNGKPPADPRYPALSLPVWDISDDEITEWSKTIGTGLAGLAAERIRDGMYQNGEEIYPPDSAVYREATRESISSQMELLVERGMATREGDRWYAIAPGRMEPSLQRATKIFLDRRADLPPALITALDSWKHTLETRGIPTELPKAPRPAHPSPIPRSSG